jgi:hypothetical protein
MVLSQTIIKNLKEKQLLLLQKFDTQEELFLLISNNRTKKRIELDTNERQYAYELAELKSSIKK